MKSILLTLAVCGLASAAFGQAAAPAWYRFSPTSTPEPGEIGLQSWLDSPAGAHGRIVRDGEKLMYNGQPIRLWGVNLCFGNCVPPHEMADKRAAFYAKYGINAVRLHKFTESDYATGNSAVDFSASAIDRLDYQIAQLKKHGIYTTLSVHFGAATLGPDDRQYVPWIDEIGKFSGNGRGAPRVKAEHSALFYSPELQKLHQAQMLKLLAHRNQYTGLTYAEDPAIAFIEIINEQSVFFYTSLNPLRAYPTLRKQVGTQFSDWLLAKYGSEDALVKAWGPAAFDGFEKGFEGTESLAKRDILPLGNPWYWAPENLNSSQLVRRQRLLDSLEFLHMLQSDCYLNYEKAMRAAGYQGEFIGSNWQAGSGVSHFANLHTDYLAGTIDRHNYFGGGGRAGQPFNNRSMLERAGSGMLSSGLQQVVDRPFMMSEWIHVYPNEWGAEGPAIMGAYGLGLQGWDASFMFQNGDSGTFSPQIGRDQWDAVAPQVLGVFPAVARQVLRGDVQESPVVAVQNVNMPALFKGHLATDSTVQQGYDEKEIKSRQVPAETLAVARTAVVFADTYQPTPEFDLAKYKDGDALESSTHELRWVPGSTGASGYFTMDTAATKAVVGFAAGQVCTLGDVTITPASRFEALYVTAQGRGETLATAKKIVIVAMARARNVGMKFNAAENQVEAKGNGGILLEPVRATIQLKRGGNPRVVVLTQDGLRTDQTLPVTDGTFEIDGTRDQTPYYLVEYP